jgi:hypothetical protein
MDKYKKALLLDSSYMARNVISTERAFVISYKGNAEVIQNHPVSFKLVNPELDYKKPSVIRVFDYINMPFQKVSLSRENIFKRDNYSCVYCGVDGNKKTLTLDHVYPQSKGGKNSWDNLVTACQPCNSEKADLTLEEYGKEIPKPSRPHHLMLMKNLDYIPKEWMKYFLF